MRFCFGSTGSWSRVSGWSLSRVKGLGYRVRGVGYRVKGVGPRVKGQGSRVRGQGRRVSDQGYGARTQFPFYLNPGT